MYRLTVAQLRASGSSVRDVVSKYHPIKVATALECWGYALGRPWSSLMAEANQKRYVRVAPSISRLMEALARRRKPISDIVAAEILASAVSAIGYKDMVEKPAQGARKEAMRKLVALAIAAMERNGVVEWDSYLQPTVADGSLDFDMEGHCAQVRWHDIGFGELSIEVGIAVAGKTNINLREDPYSRDAWIARCRFWVERQDGPFVQGLMPKGALMLSQVGKKLLGHFEIPSQESRRYRFVDRVWM